MTKAPKGLDPDVGAPFEVESWFDKFSKASREAAKEMLMFGKDFEKMAKVVTQTAVKGLGVGVSKAFRAMGTAIAEGKSPLKEFGRAVLQMAGDVATQLGQMFILEGIARSWAGHPNGPSLIAAGAALSLFGGLMGGAATPGHSVGDSRGTPVSSGVGPAGGSTFTDREVFGPESIHEKQVGTVVNVNVAGDILDSDQTGKRLVDLINDAFNHQGVVIEQGIA